MAAGNRLLTRAARKRSVPKLVADAKLGHVNIRSSETLLAHRQDIIGHRRTQMNADKKTPALICVHLCPSVAEFVSCAARRIWTVSVHQTTIIRWSGHSNSMAP